MKSIIGLMMLHAGLRFVTMSGIWYADFRYPVSILTKYRNSTHRIYTWSNRMSGSETLANRRSQLLRDIIRGLSVDGVGTMIERHV